MGGTSGSSGGTSGATSGHAGTSGSGAAGASGGEAGGGGGGAAGGSGGAQTSLVPLDPTLLTHCTGTNPILCTLNAPNGDYDVSVEVGDPTTTATSQVAAETRHYAGPAVTTAAGAYSVQSFTVNVRQEQHDGGQSAPGNILDLAITGAAPKLHGLGFRAAPSAVTIFIASDSTVCDWVSTNTSALAPDQTGWGQELSMYLKPGIAVANYADSGETASSFYTKFFPAARTAMKAGDYLFIQFGHNDQKVAADVTNYKANLMKYVTDARAKNVTPVIFTPVSRESGTAANPGFDGLDQQARDLAAASNVALIDLTALSRAYYTTVPSKAALFIDGTHFHEVGAIGVAGVVASAIKASSLPVNQFVK
jgi:lysophospholipase L1-like esterase